MVYYGLSYNTPNLYGDMYINFFIGQMVEIPSVAFTMFIIYRYVQVQIVRMDTDLQNYAIMIPFTEDASL